MKTAKYSENQKFEIVDIPLPNLGDGETIIKVDYCAICGSDLHSYASGENTDVLGHEFAGTIVEIGPNPPQGVAIGQRVVVCSLTPCGYCPACEKGRINLCENRRRPNPGGYSQYIKTVKAGGKKMIYQLPDEISTLEASMIEPLSVAVHAVNVAMKGLSLNDTVVVFGAGTIGLLVTQVLKTIGNLKIIQVDISEKRLKIAEEIGADYTINAKLAPNIIAEIEKITGPGRNNFSQPGTVDIVFECAGSAETIWQALKIVRGGGHILSLALTNKNPSISIPSLVYKEVTWQGIYCFTYEYPAAIDLLKNKKINIEPLITDIYPLERINEAFVKQMDAEKSVKIIIDCRT